MAVYQLRKGKKILLEEGPLFAIKRRELKVARGKEVVLKIEGGGREGVARVDGGGLSELFKGKNKVGHVLIEHITK